MAKKNTSIYQYTAVNICGDIFCVHIDLSKLTAIKKDGVTMLLYFDGAKSPVDTLYTAMAEEMLLNAWENWKQYAWVNRAGGPT